MSRVELCISMYTFCLSVITMHLHVERQNVRKVKTLLTWRFVMIKRCQCKKALKCCLCFGVFTWKGKKVNTLVRHHNFALFASSRCQNCTLVTLSFGRFASFCHNTTVAHSATTDFTYLNPKLVNNSFLLVSFSVYCTSLCRHARLYKSNAYQKCYDM